MRQGVVLDCGRHTSGQGKKDDDDWWLDLYVMLSRATRLEDILLMRAPDVSFLLHGPPESLSTQLKRFQARTTRGRNEAVLLAKKLNFEELIRDTM